MNGMERVMAAMNGRPANRRAVSLVLSLYGARLTKCPLKLYYTDPAAYARGQSAVYNTFKPDILFAPFALPFEGEAFGSRVRYFEDQPPNLASPAINSADEIGRLCVPDIEDHPKLNFFRESIRLMAKEHGRDVPIAAIVLDPIGLSAMIMGLDGWLNTLLFDGEGVKRMLNLVIPYFADRANALLEEGASFIVIPGAVANPMIVSRSIVETTALSVLREAYALVNGPIVMHSGGAPLAPFIDMFTGLPNVAGFVLNGGDNLVRARDAAGRKALLIGNVDGPTLSKRSPEAIRSECMDVLLNRENDPCFILGTSGADIAYDTPPENIHAFLNAAEEEGGMATF